MILSHIKPAIRKAIGNWLYTTINIVGLGIGLACCLLILLFVRHELSYESAFEKADRIYRISREYFPIDGARARVPAQNNWPVAEVLPQDFSEVELTGRIWGGAVSLKRGELTFEEESVRFADNTILQIFDFDWLAGDPANALAEPNSIVLTETLARKYFPGEEALGATLDGGRNGTLRVTGIIRDLPPNTHLDLTGMVALATITQSPNGNPFATSWNGNTDFHTYFLLREGVNVASIESRIPDFLNRHVDAQASTYSTMKIMNVRDIHLHSDRDEEWKTPGGVNTIYAFAGVAFLILLIACINFVSISTARSTQRVREVGVRRAIGASRRELMRQFLGESVLMTLVAIVFALILVELALPAFSAFTGIEFSIATFTEPGPLILLAILTLFTAVAAGSYPAFFLANLRSGRMLRGGMSRDAAGLRFRNALVVFQFSIAIALVIATSVIYLQRQYAGGLDLGFERNGIVVLASPRTFASDYNSFKQTLLSESSVESVTTSHFLPFGFNDNQMPVLLEGMTNPVRIQYMLVEYDFFETYDMDVLSGRSFSPGFPGDEVQIKTAQTPNVSSGFVVNAAAARMLGLDAETAIGKSLRIPLPAQMTGGAEAEFSGTIVGVVNDTYFESVRNAMRPLIFLQSPVTGLAGAFRAYSQVSIRVNPAMLPAALAHIDATARELYPDLVLQRRFLSQDFEAMYVAEERQGTLLFTFAALAVLIACFGLFGLASFNAERRTKEIGVRKVMGGSVWSIVLLLTNDFSKLVLLANVIAWPVAWVTMNRWLEQFAYRIDLTPLIFVGSGLIALCIAWVTVGGTAAKAANAKPVLALRYE